MTEDGPRFQVRHEECGTAYLVDTSLPPYRRFALAIEYANPEQAGRVALALNRFYMQEGNGYGESPTE